LGLTTWKRERFLVMASRNRAAGREWQRMTLSLPVSEKEDKVRKGDLTMLFSNTCMV